MLRRVPLILFPCLLWLSRLGFSAESFPPDQVEFFEKQVRPLLAEHCYDCHGAHKHQNGLRLDSRAAVLRGSDYGPVVLPGKPAESKLIRMVKHSPGSEPMPKGGGQLKPEEIAALEKWVALGLPWAADSAPAHAEQPAWQQHWAYQPVKPLPGSMDSLVQAKLKAAGLAPAPKASEKDLLRRLYVTLTGLPPSFEQAEAYLQDTRSDKYQRLVESLLASPRYGERWARIWLDVARYSDTEGYQVAGKDIRYPYSYTYRDWVIQAMNEDMPYDRFVQLQLAADRLEPGDSPHLAALGFLTLNDTFIGDKNLQTDDRIDVITRGLMGLTVACARCHNHKYDPIPSRDYYAIYSMLASSRIPTELPIIGTSRDKAAAAAFAAEVAKIEAEKNAFRQKVYDDMRDPKRISEYLLFCAKRDDRNETSLRGEAAKAGLRDRIVKRWITYLQSSRTKGVASTVFSPWHELAALTEKDFPARAAELVKKYATQPELNAVVREKFTTAPKSLAEVATRYAELFTTSLKGQAPPQHGGWQQVAKALQTPASPFSATLAEMDGFFTRADDSVMVKLNNQKKAKETSSPGAPPRAMVMLDEPKPRDVRVMIRGNPGRPGEPAPRAWLTMFGGEKFTDGSGRLELARKISSRENPLTARVLVNRIWLAHFGRPLVNQTSDLGVQTALPVQADVLDHLAAEFMAHGWSMKWLHRTIVHSRTWQQSCESTPQKDLKDADNALLSRMNRQRLDYESMRDAVLARSASLIESHTGGPSTPLKDERADQRRSVYLFVDRYEQATVPAMFDFANPDSHSPQRFTTTVPQQALFLMNSPFMRKHAELLASKSKTVQDLYQLALGRAPTAMENQRAQSFLDEAKKSSLHDAHWTYGTMKATRRADGDLDLSDWLPFTHRLKQGKGSTYAHAEKIPDPVWSYASWGPAGGHAAQPSHAIVARWQAPADMKIDITGTLFRAAADGDGVYGYLSTPSRGIVDRAQASPKDKGQLLGIQGLDVKAGEEVSFIIHCGESTQYDSFQYLPLIYSKGSLVTDFGRDFCGRDAYPLNRERPQPALAQLAQILLMSNEFHFVD